MKYKGFCIFVATLGDVKTGNLGGTGGNWIERLFWAEFTGGYFCECECWGWFFCYMVISDFCDKFGELYSC